MAIGLTGVLLVSGVIEAFVTPSGLPTWARIAIGVAAEVAFLGYVWVYGRRAAEAGETGDIAADRPRRAPRHSPPDAATSLPSITFTTLVDGSPGARAS